MPDWFYRTVSRPLLYRLPARAARSFALRFMGRLARLPLGGRVIDLLGHMRPDPRLSVSVLGVEFPAAVGLGPGLDVEAVALPALARFGVGFLSVGPVGAADPPRPPPVERDDEREAIGFPDPHPQLGLATALPRLREAAASGLPVLVRVAANPGAGPAEATAQLRQVAAAVRDHAAAVVVTTLRSAAAGGWSAGEWGEHIRAAVEAVGGRPVLLAVPADVPADKTDPLVAAGLAAGAAGVLVGGEVARPGGGTLIGGPAQVAAVERVRAVRARFGPAVPVVAAGGVHEPEHALALLATGADLVEIDSGLVFTGPGLVKRANDAVLYQRTRTAPAPAPTRPAEMTWFWTALMGVGMLIGSVLALVIAATRVVLPYDEAFLGMSRDELTRVNPRLLAFMAHDRVSLAGTMVAVGVLYVGLSLGGIRRGLHWAMVAVFASAFVGFASFFLFLGFGYLDTLHAFVTACLLQLLLIGVHARLGVYVPDVPPAVRTDRARRLAQWGQLLLVLQAVAVLVTGLVISTVGVTGVFVPEDLEFMRTTTEQLTAANPRLLPLVAHDRATFGGMLVATGLTLLLAGLWGFRAGNSWLWWTLLAAGVAGYAPAIAVHFAVGYTNGMHLLPAFLGLGVYLLALALSRPYLCRPAADLRAVWATPT
jgi:dihydroorotate dehydrogenase